MYTFYRIFGLKLNPSKSEWFCFGINQKQIQEMVDKTGFKIRITSCKIPTKRKSSVEGIAILRLNK